MVQQILSGGGEGPSAGLTGVLNQVQTLMQPLLNQASADPNSPDLRPAVQQILQGFTGLTQALVATNTNTTTTTTNPQVPLALLPPTEKMEEEQ